MSSLQKKGWFNTDFLFQEVSVSSLAIIRIVTGMVIFKDFLDFHWYITESLATSKFFLTYDGFHWIKPFPGYLLELYFNLMYLVCILFALGIQPRINAVLIWLGFTYFFLLDKGHYNNHFYLYTMLLFFFVLTDSHKGFSVYSWVKGLKREEQKVPYWQVWVFKMQIFIVYFYGGIAKCHGDWIKGFPMRFWLYDNSFNFESGLIRVFLQSEFGAMFISYGGLIFDFSIGFLLLNRRTRLMALPFVLTFHISNMFLWRIGTFPMAMIGMTTIFFDPDWFDKLRDFLKNKPLQQIQQFFKNQPFQKAWRVVMPYKRTTEMHTYGMAPIRQHQRKLVLGFLSIWFVVQFIFPFRRYAWGGNPSWTGLGHYFAWRMMLVDSVDATRMTLIIPETGEELPIDFLQYMNWKQFRKMRRNPKNLLRFAHFIRDEAKTKGGIKDPAIKMEVWKSVNERPPKLLNDTTINYATLQYSALAGVPWIYEWKESDVEPTFSLHKYSHWKHFLMEHGEEETME